MTAAVAAYARSFDPSPASVRAARRFVIETIEASPFAPVAEPASLLASELVTNAVLHARTSFTVQIDLGDDRVRVTVRDGSEVGPARRAFSELAGSGRGLHLVDTISDRWGFEGENRGKRVWFELTIGDENALAFDLDSVESL